LFVRAARGLPNDNYAARPCQCGPIGRGRSAARIAACRCRAAHASSRRAQFERMRGRFVSREAMGREIIFENIFKKS
jgi:hypothetical protein